MMTSKESRQLFVDSLSALIAHGKEDVADILTKLEWSKEKVLEGSEMVTCPVNHNHSVPEKSLARHIKECQLVREGYSRQEQKEMQSNTWFYANTKSVVSITIDQQTQNQILSRVSGSAGMKPVPKTMDRLEKDFTSDEKLALYEYVTKKAKEAGKGSTVPLEDLAFDPNKFGQKGKSESESAAAGLAKQRDLKRRRQTYRAKNVHITRRSQTQIMKEIIDAQMTELEDIYKDEQRRKRREERRKERNDDVRDERRDDRYLRQEEARRERRERRREYRREERRGHSDESGDEGCLPDRVRVKIEVEEEEEGEVLETHDSRGRSRHSSRDRSPRDNNGHFIREGDRSPSPTHSSRHSDHERDPPRHSREHSVDSSVCSRHSSRERSVERDERHSGQRHKKKRKKDHKRRSHHKHKHSHDKIRIKEEKI